ncbi:hypothetical protein DFJ68_2204 [Terracoccus luteus]|uniref:Uncharacterized protein n=1 Tax=Terracoccus luteus TaxID=53356 RepID=A0A495Y031_9MICO|nr:hypothetical protein [Terracoccus luteus]RKT78755.1 hypothetical protein DFJ68_2204 [Terracoccus luteus]
MSYFHTPVEVLRVNADMAAALDAVNAANVARFAASERQSELLHAAYDLANERGTDLKTLAGTGALVDLRAAERAYTSADAAVDRAERSADEVFARDDVRQSLVRAASRYYLDAQSRAETGLDIALAALTERQSVEAMARVGLGSHPYFGNRLNPMGLGSVVDAFTTYVRIVPVDAVRATAEGK